MRGLLLLALVAACTEEVEPEPTWQPGLAVAQPSAANERGLFDVRGLIHAHSVYSHDACDDEPVKNGVRDQACLEDFRRGLCTSGHDFVMLTDHPVAFREYEYPTVLLFDPARDELLERGGLSVANRMGCPDGRRPLVVPGYESELMPVGIEQHLEDRTLYSSGSTLAIEAMRGLGAVVLLAHPEMRTVDQLVADGIDGFEMYNVHANVLHNGGTALELLVRLDRGDTDLPQSDLAFILLFNEDTRYLNLWSKALARGVKRVTTMGTDCHQNTFPAIMPDGERVDSYRRLMMWFSNHLLVDRLDFDDASLKEALRAGRLYGVIEVLGYADGFDFTARANGEVKEMGAEVAAGTELVVKRPKVRGIPESRQPSLQILLLRATDDGWEEAASSDTGDLTFVASAPGAYRAEVRMIPSHVREFLGFARPMFVDKSVVWIYSNAIYVR